MGACVVGAVAFVVLATFVASHLGDALYTTDPVIALEPGEDGSATLRLTNAPNFRAEPKNRWLRVRTHAIVDGVLLGAHASHAVARAVVKPVSRHFG